MLKIFIGYDAREDIAWHVARHSIVRRATCPVAVYPLRQQALRDLGLYARGEDSASTEFSLTRFLTPYLAAHDGWSVFVDCDVLFTRDIGELLPCLDPQKAVYCVQHDYTPALAVKMDGKAQAIYPRKNWSSFMVFNGMHPEVKALTPSVANNESPTFLHRFGWVSDKNIGALDLEWNFLVGEYPRPTGLPMCVHFTNGGPWLEEWRQSDFAPEWLAERDHFEASKRQE
jgi:hypothetical protein